LKVTEFNLRLSARMHDQEEDRLLEALKRNYIVQRVKCTRADWDGDLILFNEANQARLEFFLDRNRKLKQWMANPKLVPCELWSYAILLALEAGANALYQSLLSLSGQGVGLKKQGRKRKLPQYFKP